ncbi:cyclic GMP-AMP synthase [Caerostris darwini]|uniref:Cyclic GMP-AMP synthase n=1 Tax=Caerostris darwini TaxID=1538125 RepID=A0AAV4T4S0_9ARAC|nr:cyclic GMP-AMP synthase [Caerostris darwini]
MKDKRNFGSETFSTQLTNQRQLHGLQNRGRRARQLILPAYFRKTLTSFKSIVLWENTKVLQQIENKESQRAEEICNQRMAYCDAEAFQPKKLRKPGVTILKEILKSIKLDENLIRENNEILQMFLSSFIEEMKNTDKIFKLLYQRPHFTGSYYSDLRISKPDEFDINLVLHLPFKPYEFEVLYHSQVPSYSKYALKNPAVAAINYPELCKLLFENGYLIPEKVRKWIQSVIDRTMCTYKRQIKSIGDIRFSSSGPARTIRLIKYTGDCIDIDLVPAIPCTLETKQPGIDGRVRMKLGATLETFLVPKPFSPSGQAPVNSSEISRLWRTHFPVSEEQLIHNKGCVKPVIKLLKLLRDKNNWKILASYYLKTVVMWMLLENSNEEYWKEDKLDERFIEALKKLLAYVKAQNIPYFFSKKNNLLSKLQYGEAVNISGKLSSIINAVERDPFNYWKEFGVFPTFTIWNAKNKYSKL